MTSRLYDGKEWHEIVDDDGDEHQQVHGKVPLAPILNGDGRIFVSIPSYRDGERCGKTVMDIFQKAKDPDNIIVGIVDQSYEDDKSCLEVYCKELGFNIYSKPSLRKDTTKVILNQVQHKNCPRADQIRKVSVHHFDAKGPSWARALSRKILGNEEFCLQIDSHNQFVQDWDEKLKMEWAATRNEFGIISTVPLGYYEMEHKEATTVTRGCEVEYQDNKVPHFNERGDGKIEHLKKPFLAHTWSSAFSFAKCHLEESAPYDPFTPFVMGVENFARFARFWTRGYDVYTPTQNIIYHSFQPNPEGHRMTEWFHPKDQRHKDEALKRIRSYLGAPDALEDYNLANLGIYGLGKRRTLQQLEKFLQIDIANQVPRPRNAPCMGHEWVPYNMDISPTENLFKHPDNLDPQPEFPMRTECVFYEEEAANAASIDVLEGDIMGELGEGKDGSQQTNPHASPFPSGTILFPLWIVGLVIWYMSFASTPTSRGKQSRQKAGAKDS
ncbi:unnamed protein product [Cylindrotheca closterium]|uniref:Uncharacterized protein n=1 Tax=Cylindrotheca closterium TaxID=2856 RepID=A0AAD2JNT1_9STRA|nr:unnamed protein product [Cylindrotheca closterium]